MNLWFTTIEAEKFKIKALTNLLFGKGPACWFIDPCPLAVPTFWIGEGSTHSLYMSTNLLHHGSAFLLYASTKGSTS